MLCVLMIGLNLCFIKYTISEIHSCVVCQNLTSYVYEENRALKSSYLKNLLKFSLPKDVCLIPDKQVAFKFIQFEQISDYKSSWLSYVAYFSKQIRSLFPKECLLCSKKKKILSVHCSNPFHSDTLTKLIYGSSVKFNIKDSMCYIPQHVKNSEKKKIKLTFYLNKDKLDSRSKQLTVNTNSSQVMKNNTVKCLKADNLMKSINKSFFINNPNSSSLSDVCRTFQQKSYLKIFNNKMLVDFKSNNSCSYFEKSAKKIIFLKSLAGRNDYISLMTSFKYKKLDNYKVNGSNAMKNYFSNVHPMKNDLSDFFLMKNDLSDVCLIKNILSNVSVMEDNLFNVFSMKNDVSDICPMKNDMVDVCPTENGLSNVCSIKNNLSNVCAMENSLLNILQMKNDISDVRPMKNDTANVCPNKNGLSNVCSMKNNFFIVCAMESDSFNGFPMKNDIFDVCLMKNNMLNVCPTEKSLSYVCSMKNDLSNVCAMENNLSSVFQKNDFLDVYPVKKDLSNIYLMKNDLFDVSPIKNDLSKVCLINESWISSLKNFFFLHKFSQLHQNISLNQNMSLLHLTNQNSCIVDGIPKFDSKNENRLYVKKLSVLESRLAYKYIYKRMDKVLTGDTISGFLTFVLLNFIILFGKINPVRKFYKAFVGFNKATCRSAEKNIYHEQKAEKLVELSRKSDWKNFDLELLVAIVEISYIAPGEH